MRFCGINGETLDMPPLYLTVDPKHGSDSLPNISQLTANITRHAGGKCK
jgi:hypothetical protein